MNNDENAFESYSMKIYAMLEQSVDVDDLVANDDAIIEMIAEFFDDGTDPLHPERAESRIIDELGL